ncbi:MAG TPA: hypothetical protein VF111_04000, partial [Thermoanaerobaculia bacterium]
TTVVSFTETAESVAITFGSSKFSLRRATRTRTGELPELSFEVEAEMKDVDAGSAEIIEGIRGFLKLGALGSAARNGDLEDIARTAAMAFPLKSGEQLFGLEMEFTKAAGGPWKCKVLISHFQSFDSAWTATNTRGGLKIESAIPDDLKKLKKPKVGIEAEVKYGTYVDVSPAIQSLLDILADTPPKKTLSMPRKLKD